MQYFGVQAGGRSGTQRNSPTPIMGAVFEIEDVILDLNGV